AGCGTFANLTALSLIDDPELRPASVMGGTQYDTYLLKRGRREDGARAAFDMLFSICGDLALLPITLPIAALVGDEPFDRTSYPPRPSPPEKPDPSEPNQTSALQDSLGPDARSGDTRPGRSGDGQLLR
ncbi:MAG TPA: hypothetical protein VEN81_11475, partial [Planctomycetota bacterium]|nr:hypothetical protein [Planctomycetota bacterium]